MNENFVDVIIENKKLSQHKCKHCDHQTIKSAAKNQQHLQICEAFQKKQERKNQTKSSKNTVQLFIISLIRLLSQAQITVVHRAAAMFIYMTNLSFNHFENSYVLTHHQALCSSYKSFSRKLVTDKLLNEIYEIVKLQVMQMLNSCNHFSFFIDETINIRKERVINLCCHVSSFNDESFHLKAIIEVAEKMSAVVQAE
jgi:hypothetical protein